VDDLEEGDEREEEEGEGEKEEEISIWTRRVFDKRFVEFEFLSAGVLRFTSRGTEIALPCCVQDAAQILPLGHFLLIKSFTQKSPCFAHVAHLFMPKQECLLTLALVRSGVHTLRCAYVDATEHDTLLRPP
jgi:hypothetical protein